MPQIPGAPSPSNRVTTPQEVPESPRDPSESQNERVDGKPLGGSNLGEESSREPEGRSQNSSPATSLVRGHTLEQWPREKPQHDAWEPEDLKNVLRDLNSTRDQLMALQHLVSIAPDTKAPLAQSLTPLPLVSSLCNALTGLHALSMLILKWKWRH